MSSLSQIPDDIRNEFIVDAEGKVFAKSLRAVGRLAGVSANTLFNKRVSGDTGLLVRIRDSQKLPKTLKRFAGQDFTVTAKIPDLLVAGIIAYYAYESDAANDTAWQNHTAMGTLGVRLWFQQELGWKPPQTVVMSKVEALRAYADMIEAKEKLETKHPGLRLLSGETVELEGLPPSFTIREWLDYKEYPATTQQCKNFGKLVANTKRSLMQLKYHTDVQQSSHREYCYDDLDMITASWESFNEPDE